MRTTTTSRRAATIERTVECPIEVPMNGAAVRYLSSIEDAGR